MRRKNEMPNTYKPRVQNVDAGCYSLEIVTGADGSVAIAIVHVSAETGIRSVAHVAGRAAPAEDGTLLTAMDAYDAGNCVKVRY